MKPLIRWARNLGVASTVVVGSVVLSPLLALSLSIEQITQKLSTIPVFAVADKEGIPFTASLPKQAQDKTAPKPITLLFLSQKDAASSLERLKTQSPDLAKGAQVRPFSMAEIYNIETKTQGKPEQANFVYIPAQKQLDAAVSVSKQNGQDIKQFPGTPLFVASSAGAKANEVAFLTIQEGKKSFVPMFFDQEQMQGFLERVKRQQPDVAGKVKVQVYSLEAVLDAMRTQKDPQLENFEIIPSQEALQFLQAIQKNQPAAPSTPAAKPPAKKK